MSTTWLITGASSGFGRGLTQTLLARGDRVAATVRRADALADLQAAHGNALTVLQLDVRDTAAVQAVVAQAFAALGRIDVVISNAGYGTLGAAEAATDAQVRALIDTNLIGSISVIQAALPHLRRQGGGHVVQVSSEGGQIAYPGFSLYHASKWGSKAMSKRCARKWPASASSSPWPNPARRAPTSAPHWNAPHCRPTTPTPRSTHCSARWTTAAGSSPATRSAWWTR